LRKILLGSAEKLTKNLTGNEKFIFNTTDLEGGECLLVFKYSSKVDLIIFIYYFDDNY